MTSLGGTVVDAVVIGGGPNGLVAANLLADAGWDVLLLEAMSKVGGAVASDSDVADGFVHDTFSSFYPLSAISPVIQGMGLEHHGLRWSRAPAAIGSPTRDGDWALVHPDPARTAQGLDRLHPGDGAGWSALWEKWERLGPALVRSLLTPFPPVRGGAGLLARLPRAGGIGGIRTMLQSARSLAESHLSGDAAQLLLVGNAAHADLSPDAAGSGLFGWLLAMLGQQVGFPVPQGGAGMLAKALEDRFRSGGGTIRCETRVTRAVVERGRVTGVVTADGERITARRSVVADVPAPALYGGLVDWNELPGRTRTRMADFEWDSGTVKVDWALSGPIPWISTPVAAPGTVHLADSITDVSLWMAKVTGSIVPADPFLLVGQMTSADPLRSPVGTESVWAYTHVPQHVKQDEAGTITGRWDDADAQRMADRMQARIERAAPGFGSRIIARRILTPRDLESRNPSLVGGALGGGTSALHQQLVFRPIPGLGRAETPVKGLYLGSSSAHPGGGVHGSCGANAARAALWHDRFRRHG